MPKQWVFIGAMLSALLLVSCAEKQPTPAPAPVATARAIDAKAIFAARCAACHGSNREGISGLGLALTPERLASQSDDSLWQTIANGRPGTVMPPWKDTLSPKEIDALIQLIKYAPAR